MNAQLVRELIDSVEREVNNGGFDQFFFNSASDRTSEIIHALNAIGAQRTATILEDAASKFPGGVPPADRNERQNLIAKISPNSDAFETQDERFLQYKDDLTELVNAYVSKLR